MGTLFATAVVAIAAVIAGPLPRVARWEYQGVVESIDDGTFDPTRNPYRGVFAVGDPWSAAFDIDLTSPRTPASGLGNYDQAITDAWIQFDRGQRLELWGQDFVHIDYPSTTPHATMQFSSVGSLGYHIVQFSFFDWQNPPFNLPDLARKFDLSQIGYPAVSVASGSGGSHRMTLMLTSARVVIPEPSTAVMALFGGCAFRRRREFKSRSAGRDWAIDVQIANRTGAMPTSAWA